MEGQLRCRKVTREASSGGGSGLLVVSVSVCSELRAACSGYSPTGWWWRKMWRECYVGSGGTIRGGGMKSVESNVE